MASERAGETLDAGLAGIPGPGEVVAGKFVVEQVLGVGGMGVVVAARHAQLGQRVAIKFLRKEVARSPEAVSRFLREARAVVGLQSAHVVRVLDVGIADDGTPFMVMEHLAGADLTQLLAERVRLTPQDAVDYVLQGMEGIAEAHAAGIVHRDLKPANLFLTRSPDGSPIVKILDFGISKTDTMREQPSLTATSTVMGSPLYMSPEQLRSSKNVDARTDVWALGVIVYELLSGRLPFEADTVTGLCAKIAADPPTPLGAHVPGLPPGLEQVVHRCLEKDVARRYGTVSLLAAALRPFASPEGASAAGRIGRIEALAAARADSGAGPGPGPAAPPSVPSGVDSPTAHADTQSSWQTAATQGRRRRAVLIGVTSGAVLVAGLALSGVLVRRTGAATPGAVDAVPSATSVAARPAPSAAPPAAPSVAVSPPPDVVDAGPARTPAPSSTPAASRPRTAPRAAATGSLDDLLQDRK